MLMPSCHLLFPRPFRLITPENLTTNLVLHNGTIKCGARNFAVEEQSPDLFIAGREDKDTA